MNHAHAIGDALRAWFSQHARDLPWRRTRDPYSIWVSETMLQQTRVETVLPYYERFLARFPDAESLAAADEAEVLKAWEGLGYYRRARHLHQAVREVVERYDGRVPSDPEALRTLPGVGEYTAGAVASIAYGKAVPAVDGNVLRVVTRIFGIAGRIDTGPVRRAVAEAARSLIAEDAASATNQALMELGASLCAPANPQCLLCPVAQWCVARKQGRQAELPETAPRAAPRSVPAVFAVIARGDLTNGGHVALAQRAEGGLLAGLMAFPGVEGSDAAEDLVAYIRDTHGLEVEPGEELLRFRHTFSHLRWDARVVACKPRSSRTRGRGLTWAHPEELKDYAIPTAHKAIVGWVREHDSE